MQTTRLTFLYPHLFRSIRASEPVPKTVRVRPRSPRQCQPARGFSALGRRERHKHMQRHGKAVEPLPLNGEGAEGADNVKSTAAEKTKETEKSKELNKKAQKAEPDAEQEKAKAKGGQDAATVAGDSNAPKQESGTNTESTASQKAAAGSTDPLPPLDTILHMPPPESQEERNSQKPPHLQTPPYVHHFDTYTLVQQVMAGDFTAAQSITAMKAVRALLAHNLEVAKAGLVSKSDVENETYLFRAACSELRTEIQNQRKANDEAMRRERTLLQHEVDILSQKLTQELLTLKDDLKGMFDDRKIAVKMEQRAIDSKIQELNYKIAVALNSDTKSEVEGLRWVLTRRSVMGILFMAIMVLSSLRYASYKAHEEENRKKKKKKEAASKSNEESLELPAQGAAEILAAN